VRGYNGTMFVVRLRNGVFAQNARLTAKVKTLEGAVRFLESFCDGFGVLVSDRCEVGRPVLVYRYSDLWSEGAKPLAKITELPCSSLPNS
jgi:hypothetical protein